MAEEAKVDVKTSAKKDIRNYLCQYCGISRSKKYLITSHIQSHHQMELEEERVDEACEVDEESSSKHTCQECGAEFKKPAHLKQHMQSHSLEEINSLLFKSKGLTYVGRPPEKLQQVSLDHAKCLRDLLLAMWMIVLLAIGGRIISIGIFLHIKGSSLSVRRRTARVNSQYREMLPAECSTGQKQVVCKEIGCGKAFKYPSQLQKHQDSHVKLDSVEAFCSEPGCMKYFTNEECLKSHIRSCHQHINCEICGSKHLKKNIKRHLRTHDEDSSPGEIKCEVEGCSSTFSKASNLQKHMKAVHDDIRPFVCGFPGCGMRFAYKHVRNKHENSGYHVYTCGDFVETDEDFTSRPRGGLKRKQVTAEMLVRKRVMPPRFDAEEHETC
ncbi:unnamed protein product [Arabidopsis thaliana]|uniref:(thale cress) hypothetical protein n=1 Tax=Arabidopsis thaliana TaxID=3702 RepID=A0A7G2E406_ARATH|nr:unnamed protein product [Arabidopsis thaliana]